MDHEALFVFREVDNLELAQGLGDMLKCLAGEFAQGLDISIELNQSAGREWCGKVVEVFNEIMEAEPGYLRLIQDARGAGAEDRPVRER